MNTTFSRHVRAVCVALATFCAAGAQAHEQGEYYGGILGGLYVPDYRAGEERGLNLQGFGGMSLSPTSAVEANIFFQRAEDKTSAARNRAAGGSIDWHLGKRERGSPFLLLGLGGQADQEDVYPLGNIGFGYYPTANVGTKDLLRVEARWNLVQADDAAGNSETFNEFRFNVGVAIGAQPKAAPAPEIAKLADADADGVPDVVDRCPATPAWLRVDQYGCAPDADHDGVPDGIDKCPTPAGEKVDAAGCTPDADADGVTDMVDACPNTATGSTVDAQGCAALQLDADQDGVVDSQDQCLGSIARVTVEANGCVDVNKALAGQVHFGLSADGLNAEGTKVLDHVAEALRSQPGIKVEIVAHTDTTGDATYNRKLSTRRAYAVKEYLLAQGIADERLTVTGLGATKSPPEGGDDRKRAQNRRVDFRVIR